MLLKYTAKLTSLIRTLYAMKPYNLFVLKKNIYNGQEYIIAS